MDASVDFNQVATFAAVAEHGSYSAAARRLGIPKSTVSRRVSALENSLGTRLLQRTTRRVQITEAGAAYLVGIAPALRALTEATEEIRDLSGLPRGRLRVTAPVDFGEVHLGAIVAEYRRRYPDVDCYVELTDRTVDLVGEGFDLAIRAGAMADSSLVARSLGATTAWVLAAPSYLSHRSAPRHPGELADHEAVLFRPTTEESTEWELETGTGERHRVRVHGRVSANAFPFVRSALLAGAGIGLLPAFMAALDLEGGRLVRLLPTWSQGFGPLSVVYPSARHLPAKASVFRDFLLEWFAEKAWSASL